MLSHKCFVLCVMDFKASSIGTLQWYNLYDDSNFPLTRVLLHLEVGNEPTPLYQLSDSKGPWQLCGETAYIL